jgi:hypothetical protein
MVTATDNLVNPHRKFYFPRRNFLKLDGERPEEAPLIQLGASNLLKHMALPPLHCRFSTDASRCAQWPR